MKQQQTVTQTEPDQGQLLYVPIEKVFPSKTNPRKHFNEKEIEELAESIKQVGLINAVTVRPHEFPETGYYEIVAGEKRFRACQLAGLTEIKAEVRDLTDEQVIEIQIIENLHRSDVHPMDEAYGIQALLNTGKYDIKAVHNKLGKSEDYVLQRLRLLKLHENVQESFRKDEIVLGHAVLLSKLQPESQLKGLRYTLYEDWGNQNKRNTSRNISELKNWIEREIIMDLKGVNFNSKDANLIPNAGSCLDCSKRTGYNKTLFPELSKRDCCTDPKCFFEKRNAHIKKVVLKIEAKDEPYVLINNTYSLTSKNKDALSRNDYQFVPRGSECEHTVKGIIVETHDIKEEGKINLYCINKNCTIHFNRHSGNRTIKSESEKLKEASDRLRKKMYEEINYQLLRAASKKIAETDFFTKPVLLQTLGHTWEKLFHDSEPTYYEIHPEFKEKYHTTRKSYTTDKQVFDSTATFEKMLKEYFPTLTSNQLLAAIFELTLLQVVDAKNISSAGIDEDLLNAVEKLKVMTPAEIKSLSSPIKSSYELKEKEMKEKKKKSLAKKKPAPAAEKKNPGKKKKAIGK